MITNPALREMFANTKDYLTGRASEQPSQTMEVYEVANQAERTYMENLRREQSKGIVEVDETEYIVRDAIEELMRNLSGAELTIYDPETEHFYAWYGPGNDITMFDTSGEMLVEIPTHASNANQAADFIYQMMDS